MPALFETWLVCGVGACELSLLNEDEVKAGSCVGCQPADEELRTKRTTQGVKLLTDRKCGYVKG